MPAIGRLALGSDRVSSSVMVIDDSLGVKWASSAQDASRQVYCDTENP